MSSNRVDEVDRRLRELYGEVEWAAATGVVHVAAVAESSRRSIIPGESAPRSPTDRFVLGAARARADAIVTTGAILRAEPDLDHRFAPDAATERALLEWRRERLGRVEPALLVVLTRSAELPIAHPALTAAAGGFFWTTARGAESLRGASSGRPTALEIVEGGGEGEGEGEDKGVADEEAPGSVPIVSAVRAVMRRPGIETVLIEAGPRAAAGLYSLPGQPAARDAGALLRCDELLLSRFHGELLATASGPAFVPQAAIDACYARPPSEVRIEEDSGIWSFHRYRDRS